MKENIARNMSQGNTEIKYTKQIVVFDCFCVQTENNIL
jgi:hypothetical protein